MILLTILAIMGITILIGGLIVLLITLLTGGFIFGDLIVAVLIVVGIIKLIMWLRDR